MEPHFNTSFIPKKPIVAGTPVDAPRPRTGNLLSTIAGAIFVLTFLACGAAYGYKFYINSQISSIDSKINGARTSLQLPQIQKLIDANAKIVATKSLLDKHVALSQLLIMLQSLTLKKMSFSDFTYRNSDTGNIVTMKGEVQTYNALAVQQDLFSHGTFISSPNFSNFTLGSNGNITFQFTASVNSDAVSYKKSVMPADSSGAVPNP